MAFKLAELFCEIRGDTRLLDSALGAAKSGLEGLAGHSAGVGRRMSEGLFAPIRGAAQAAGAVWRNSLTLGAAGAAAGIGFAVKAASDLNEQVAKTAVVFGDASRTVLADADAMARKYGVVKTTYIEAAGGIGLIGKASGMARDASARLGVQFTRLAADAASFYNISLDEALVKIRAGLVGEAEPLRTLGVLLNEDAVKAEALRLGLQRGNAELTEGAKVQARASLILRGMADAQGDLARTSDSLANRLREVQGRWANLAADAGQHLLAPAKALVEVLGDLARSMGSWIEANEARIRGWAEGLKDAVRWARALVERRDDLLKGLWQNWKAVFAELFRTLGENFARLADYFGKALVRSIATAFNTSLLGDRQKPIGKPGPAPKFPGFVAPDFAGIPGVGKVLGEAGADARFGRFLDNLNRAGRALADLARGAREAARANVAPAVAALRKMAGDARADAAAREKNAGDVAANLRRRVEAQADARARQFLDFRRRNNGQMDPQLRRMWLRDPAAARGMRDRMDRVRRDDARRRAEARVLANPRNLRALFAGMGVAGQAAGGVMGAAGMAAAALPAALIGARLALAAQPKPQERREARFEGLEEYYKSLQLGAFGGMDPAKVTADNTGKMVDWLAKINQNMARIAGGGVGMAALAVGGN